MSMRWCQEPKLDENAKVGLTFISVSYGVVLVAVFPEKAGTLAHTGIAGLFHLALAALLLIISWMGYYSNRARFPSWCVQFFNIPLWQYILSFGILFAYWQLGITVERPYLHATPTPRSEAFTMFIVWAAYLAWDFLEVRIQESEKYVDKLNGKGGFSKPPKRKNYTTRWRKNHSRSEPGGRTVWLAKDVRACRFITFLFTIGYGIGLTVVIYGHLRGTRSVIIVDSIYIVSLFAYRFFQWKWSKWWYIRRNPQSPPSPCGPASGTRGASHHPEGSDQMAHPAPSQA